MSTTDTVQIPTALQLLQQIEDHVRRGESCYRKHLLEAGRLAHEYVQLRLSQGGKRNVAIREIGDHLEQANIHTDANRLIATYHVVQLFASDGLDLSELPHGRLRELAPLLCRDGETDAWSIREGMQEQARQIVRDALAKRWSVEQIGEAVTQALDAEGIRRRGRPRGSKPQETVPIPKAADFYGEEGEDWADEDPEEDYPVAHFESANPILHLQRAGAKDTADTLAQIINGHNRAADVLFALAGSIPPELGTALARGLVGAGAHKTINAILLVLQQWSRTAQSA